MIWLIAVLTIVFAAGFLLLPALAIRALARRKKPFYWTFDPENTFAIVVTQEEESGTGTSVSTSTGGSERVSGNIVDLLHGISGSRLEKHGTSDPMQWEIIEDEDDPRHNWMYRILGVQSMRSIYRTLRLNKDVRMRFSRDDDKPTEALHTVTKDRLVKHVHYTGEFTVVVDEADTADGLGVNFEIDFGFRRKFPIRTVLKLADSAAFLTSLVEETVNMATVSLPASGFIGGMSAAAVTPTTRANREALVNDIKTNPEFMNKILDVIGFEIISVSLRKVSMTPAQRALLQRQVDADTAAKAKIREAEGDRDAQNLRTEADKKRLDDVLIPAAETAGRVAIFQADRAATAIERTKLHTYAQGMPTVIPIGGSSATKPDEKKGEEK